MPAIINFHPFIVSVNCFMILAAGAQSTMLWSKEAVRQRYSFSTKLAPIDSVFWFIPPTVIRTVAEPWGMKQILSLLTLLSLNSGTYDCYERGSVNYKIYNPLKINSVISIRQVLWISGSGRLAKIKLTLTETSCNFISWEIIKKIQTKTPELYFS